MTDAVSRIDQGALAAYAQAVLERADLSPEDARTVGTYLAEADARGVNSHGTDLLPAYYRGFREGHLNPHAAPTAVHRAGSLAVVDGDGGLGHVVSHHAVELALELAAETGLGVVTVRDSNHFGMAAHWPLKVLRANMVGFATTNGPPVMAPWGGAEAGICNNPFSWGIPTKDETPILLDMALTSGARGRVRLAKQRGEEIPEGWALDEDGVPTTDPARALDGVMLPMGGYKGSGIAMVNEILASTFSEAHYLTQISSVTMSSVGVHVKWSIGHFFMVLNPAAFRPLDEYLAQVDAVIRSIKTTRPSPGGDGVTLPGERGFRRAAEAERLGVPLPQPSVEKLTAFEEESGVPFPAPVASAAGGVAR